MTPIYQSEITHPSAWTPASLGGKEGLVLQLTPDHLKAIDLTATHNELIEIEKQIRDSTAKHNVFLKELGLSLLPGLD